jgi:DNA-binding LacI/PurR family transcriptional regulator
MTTISLGPGDHQHWMTTKRAVLKLAKAQYQPNRLAAALRKGKMASLGVIVPIEAVFFLRRLVHGIETATNERTASLSARNEDVAQGLPDMLSAGGQYFGMVSRTTVEAFNASIKCVGTEPLVFRPRMRDGDNVNAVVNDREGATWPPAPARTGLHPHCPQPQHL